MSTGQAGSTIDRPQPLLLVTVDTEEDHLWSGRYPQEGQTTENVQSIGCLGEMLESHGCKGTYLITYPVAVSPACRDRLLPLCQDGRGEVGSHLHAWCCPPFHSVEKDLPRFPHCLPPGLQRQKLETLGAAIETAFGRAPISYRAGRWGIGSSSLEPLLRTGHTIDSSVVPGWWQKGSGAPAFVDSPWDPYRVSTRDILRPGNSELVEIPVTSGFRWAAARHTRLARLLPAGLPGGRKLLELLGYTILRPALYPEKKLLSLARSVLTAGRPVLNLMLHSSELAPGHSPYSRDRAARDLILARLRAVLEYASDAGAKPATLAEAGAACRRQP